MTEPSVVIIVADGLRPDTLDRAIASGLVPELAALRAAGGRHVLTTTFPSVTGVAYVPILTGRHPAAAGVPGLRWYDRARGLPALLGHSRSYVGLQMRRIDHDLDPAVPTAWDLARGSALGSMAMVTRGLPVRGRVEHGWRFATRALGAHLAGSVERWSALESELAGRFVDRVRRERPRFAFATLTTGDKAAHAEGAGSAAVLASHQRVDQIARQVRTDAEHDGRWASMHLYVISDHGHAPVQRHFDLADALREAGVRVRSHPWTVPDRSEAAVMVSGNSMAHVYLGLEGRARLPWPSMRSSWGPRIDDILAHPAIGLVATSLSSSEVAVGDGNARAVIRFGEHGYSYRTERGNPLAIEPFEDQCPQAVHERTMESPYPDSIEQLASLTPAPRSGDVIVSAAPGWDLRQRYEPIAHVSSHGALHAAHMLVPFLANRPLAVSPRRTADLFGLVREVLDAPKGRP